MVLPSLEASISLHEGKVGLTLEVKVDFNYDSEKPIVRFPDPHSVNARDAAKGLVIGLGLICTWYSMSKDDITANITSTTRELRHKGYPRSWWRDPLFKALERGGQLSRSHIASLLRDRPKVAYTC